MRFPRLSLLLLFTLLQASLALPGFAQVIVDDTWADGTRTDTALPAESAWYESTGGSLAVTSGTMTATTNASSSRTWWTYFTASPATPVQLAVGETLRARVTFRPSGVNASNTARGFQVGLYDFSGGARGTGSGAPNGTNVKGYLLNLNFGQTFGVNDPLQLRERTNLSSSALMSTSGDYITLSAGGGAQGQPAFTGGSEYTLELVATRTASSLQLNVTISGPGGWSVAHTANASTIVDRFDAFAIRTTKATDTANSFAFTRFHVERFSAGSAPPSISEQPKSKTVIVGQSATFTVSASGAAPLDYQWFRNTEAIPGAKAPSLALTNVQLADAGSYYVTVTSGEESATSSAATLTVNDFQPGATPSFEPAGFATLDGFASNGTSQPGGTTGGAGGIRVQVSTLAELVSYLQSTTPYVVEILNDIDLSPLANHSGGFPSDYPTGEIFVRSNKTIFSKNGATMRRGTLRIGRPSLGAQQNIIIRNLRFRDLWVLDPGGSYDTYGWDYIHIEEGSHHIWVDHCDFEKVYDGMIDMTHAVDFATVSWNVFRNQKKCHLIGHSDNNGEEDTGHLNVTFHHNHYVDVEERMPRMRFGNAHVFNLFSENLGGNGIQSTANAATLVENSYFRHPKSGTRPTREENGGLFGTIKVIGSIIENLPGVNVVFRERGAETFTFNPPFADPTPPYPYRLDPAADVPTLVPQYAGIGKLGYLFWQEENFTSSELEDPAVSGPQAVLTADGATNLMKYALLLPARAPVPASWAPDVGLDASGVPVFTYRRSSTATDLAWRVEVSTEFVTWSASNVVQERVATGADGLETWEARYHGPATPRLFFRLVLQR